VKKPSDSPSGDAMPRLVVDLDGTLIKSDLLVESALAVLKQNPTLLLSMPRWLARGKATLKEEFAVRARIDAASLPYNQELLDFLASRADQGQELILATASDRRHADAVAEHLGCFTHVLASDGRNNLSGARKLEALTTELQPREYSYVGNGRADLPLWEKAREVVVVDPEPGVLAGLRRLGREPDHLIRGRRPYWHSVLRLLRPHQWLKNVLVFVPMIAAHQWFDWQGWARLMLLFWAFCLTASGVYVANDLVDLEADRRHPRKRSRPFAAGDVPLLNGLFLAPVLVLCGLAMAFFLSPETGLLMLAYAMTNAAYSLYLKRLVVVDVFVLAGLYTLRVLAGASAAYIVPSFWLMAFCMLLFLSLAFVKRGAELRAMLAANRLGAAGRGYQVGDLVVIQAMGIAGGYLSALVLALYINSTDVVGRYSMPQGLWVVCVILLLWCSRLWVKVGRGDMHDDPLVFAVTDRGSLILALAACVAIVASL